MKKKKRFSWFKHKYHIIKDYGNEGYRCSICGKPKSQCK